MTIFSEAPTKADKPVHSYVETPDIEIHAAINTVQKLVKKRLDTISHSIKNTMLNHFANEGAKTGLTPKNYTGINKNSTASLQLKRSTSVLSEDNVKILSNHGIHYDTDVLQEEAFIINSKYSKDQALLKMVSEALEDLNLPEDFIIKQEQKTKNVPSTKSIEDIFATKDEKKIKLLLPLVSNLSITSKLGNDDNAFKIVDEDNDRIVEEVL